MKAIFSSYFCTFHKHFRCVQLHEDEPNGGTRNRAERYSADVKQSFVIQYISVFNDISVPDILKHTRLVNFPSTTFCKVLMCPMAATHLTGLVSLHWLLLTVFINVDAVTANKTSSFINLAHIVKLVDTVFKYLLNIGR